MKTDLEIIKELTELNIQVYKLRGTDIIETCTNGAYCLQFKSYVEAYDYHIKNINLNSPKRFKLVITSTFHFHVETLVNDEILCSDDKNIYKSEIIKAIKDYEDRGYVMDNNF